MGCVQSYFKKALLRPAGERLPGEPGFEIDELGLCDPAHSAGMSPSSTQSSEKPPLEEADIKADEDLDNTDIEKDFTKIDANDIKELLEEENEDGKGVDDAGADDVQENEEDKKSSLGKGLVAFAAATGTVGVLGVAAATAIEADSTDVAEVDVKFSLPEDSAGEKTESPEVSESSVKEDDIASSKAEGKVADETEDTRPVSAATEQEALETRDEERTPAPEVSSRPASSVKSPEAEVADKEEESTPAPEVSSRPASSVKSPEAEVADKEEESTPTPEVSSRPASSVKSPEAEVAGEEEESTPAPEVSSRPASSVKSPEAEVAKDKEESTPAPEVASRPASSVKSPEAEVAEDKEEESTPAPEVSSRPASSVKSPEAEVAEDKEEESTPAPEISSRPASSVKSPEAEVAEDKEEESTPAPEVASRPASSVKTLEPEVQSVSDNGDVITGNETHSASLSVEPEMNETASNEPEVESDVTVNEKEQASSRPQSSAAAHPVQTKDADSTDVKPETVEDTEEDRKSDNDLKSATSSRPVSAVSQQKVAPEEKGNSDVISASSRPPSGISETKIEDNGGPQIPFSSRLSSAVSETKVLTDEVKEGVSTSSRPASAVSAVEDKKENNSESIPAASRPVSAVSEDKVEVKGAPCEVASVSSRPASAVSEGQVEVEEAQEGTHEIMSTSSRPASVTSESKIETTSDIVAVNSRPTSAVSEAKIEEMKNESSQISAVSSRPGSAVSENKVEEETQINADEKVSVSSRPASAVSETKVEVGETQKETHETMSTSSRPASVISETKVEDSPEVVSISSRPASSVSETKIKAEEIKDAADVTSTNSRPTSAVSEVKAEDSKDDAVSSISRPVSAISESKVVTEEDKVPTVEEKSRPPSAVSDVKVDGITETSEPQHATDVFPPPPPPEDLTEVPAVRSRPVSATEATAQEVQLASTPLSLLSQSTLDSDVVIAPRTTKPAVDVIKETSAETENVSISSRPVSANIVEKEDLIQEAETAEESLPAMGTEDKPETLPSTKDESRVGSAVQSSAEQGVKEESAEDASRPETAGNQSVEDESDITKTSSDITLPILQYGTDMGSRAQSATHSTNEPEADHSIDDAASISESQKNQSLNEDVSKSRPTSGVPQPAEERQEGNEEKMSSAATTIQASFRGFQTRQAMQKKASDPETLAAPRVGTHDSLFGAPVVDQNFPDDFLPDESLTDVTVDDESLVTDGGFDPDEEPINDDMTDEELKALQKPQDCDELSVDRLGDAANDVTEKVDLTNAATKIQAGVRGYLTRKQINNPKHEGNSTPSIGDSQPSDNGVSIEDDVHTSGSMETQIQRQQQNTLQSVDEKDVFGSKSVLDEGDKTAAADDNQSANRETPESSLSNHEVPSAVVVQVKSSTLTTDSEEDQKVWGTLQKEMDGAATRIQSNYRGFKTRQMLQREDAMQLPTTSSSTAPSISAENEVPQLSLDAVSSRHTGEFHDMIVNSSPIPAVPEDRQPIAKEFVRHSGEFHDLILNNSPIPTVPKDDPPIEKVMKHTGEFHDMIIVSPTVNGIKENSVEENHVTDVTSTAGRTDDVATAGRLTSGGGDTQSESEAAATKIQSSYRGYKTRQDMKTVDAAVTKIQAGYRGFKVRKQLRQGKSKNVPRGCKPPSPGSAPPKERSTTDKGRNVEEVVVVRQDGEESIADRSATKIQAGVRGYLVRKRRQTEKDAAVKIQAGFRGFKTRREVRSSDTGKAIDIQQ